MDEKIKRQFDIASKTLENIIKVPEINNLISTPDLDFNITPKVGE